MGTGRTGTTILEVLLTNSEGFNGMGEVTKLFSDGFRDNKPCTCGNGFHACDYWAEARRRYLSSGAHLAETIKVNRQLDWHTWYLANYFGVIPREKLDKYFTVNKLLYEGVAASNPSRFLVDSSKYAGRCLLLKKIFPGRIKVLCMTRSPEGLINSFTKITDEQKSKSLAGILCYYSYVLFCCKLLSIRCSGEIHFLRYEDLIADPIIEIERIEKWLDADLEESKNKIKENSFFDVGHIITGNRLRKKGRIRFESVQNVRSMNGIPELLIQKFMHGVRYSLGF
jgi:hypothetical protein